VKRASLALLAPLVMLSIAAIEGAIACTVSSNVGDLSAAVNESGSEAASDAASSDGALEDSPASNADADLPLDAGCGVGFAQQGTFVDVQVRTGVQPSFAGGTIVPGMYVLTALDIFYSGNTGTMQIRETMRVRGTNPAGTFDLLTEARNPSGSFTGYPLHGETITWNAPNASIFFQTPECPAAMPEGTGNFSAQGESLTVFDAQEGIVRTYRRLP
jgi:hypothetical protein